MVSERLLLTAVFMLGGVVPLPLLKPALANREKPGSTGFIFVLLGISAWSFADAGLTYATTLGPAQIAFALRMAGPLIAASGFFILVAEYTGVLEPTRVLLRSVLALAVAIQILIWTNPLHNLVYGPEVSLTAETIRFEKMGPVWVLNTIVSHGFNVLAFLLGSREVVQSSEIRRQQMIAVLGAAIPPLALNVLSQFWVSLSFDPTVLGFVVTAFIMAGALYGGNFLDIVPVGRKQAIETMGDPVVMVDNERRIVDSNPAARSLVDEHGNWQGKPAADFFAPFTEQFERFSDAEDVTAEISVTSDGQKRHFDLDISPIRSPQGQVRGRVVVLREITAIKKRESELDLMRQVQSRVLRHNISNEMQTIRGINEMLANELTGRKGELAEKTVRASDALIQTSEKARTVERLLERERSPISVDLAAVVRDTVKTYRLQNPEVAFTVDVPAECVVKTIPAIETVVDNLVENATIHNDDPSPEVTVTLTKRPAPVLVVRDNGPGIPAHELDVLLSGEETQLSHGSGMGLWVVQWVVDQAGGTIKYDSGKAGTSVTVRFDQYEAGSQK
ncbi:histidine kinase N-terminal 7TM domain-containing protein [Halovenus salina]|uniref:histidine kinase n=1 Tax=Halovenus salina TaxID=1510225 RepID=A0ABD5W6L3_9EURY|nr:histidine kinase N-terminal 7TM domain-containing protein [Halovenus salina]